MKTKLYRPLTKNAIPDGEGFIALPISFVHNTPSNDTLRVQSQRREIER